MEIKRDEYLQRLIVRRHNGFIKVITGIRRSGKSYLLNTLFYNYLISESVNSDHIIKFAFDSAEDLLKIGEDPIVLDNEKNDRKVDPKKIKEEYEFHRLCLQIPLKCLSKETWSCCP